MPVDPPSPSGRPDHNRPSPPEHSGDPIEGDLWNLDDELPEKQTLQPAPPAMGRKSTAEDGSRDSSASVQRGKTPARAPERAKVSQPLKTDPVPATPHDEIGDLEDENDDGPSEDSVLIVLPEEEPEPPVSPAPAAKSASAQDKTLATSVKSSETEPRKNRPKASALPEKNPGISWPKPNRREVIGLGIFSFLLLLAAIWAISRFFTQLHFQSEYVKIPDFPIKGEHATLASGETFWREPVRDGPTRDVAKREVAMIPILNLSLDAEKSPLGALRVIFRNDKGETVGDSITRSFSSGRFDASGDAKISFPATDGFLDEATFNAYRTRSGNPWTADVMEGPSVDAAAGSFKKLVQIPVLPQRR